MKPIATDSFGVYNVIRERVIKMLNEDTPYANNVKDIRSKSPYKNDRDFIIGTIAYETGLVVYDYFKSWGEPLDNDRCAELAQEYAYKLSGDDEFFAFWKTYTNQ